MVSRIHRLRWVLMVVAGLAVLALEPASALPTPLDLRGNMDSTADDEGDASACDWLDYPATLPTLQAPSHSHAP